MSTFIINTSFTQEDLDRFYATGTNVVVAKPTSGGEPNVAWVVYRPLIENTMNWEEQYGIYASNSEIQNGAQLVQTSQTDYPAVTGQIYVLNLSGYFNEPVSGGATNVYTTENEYDNLPKGYMTMGLYQNANVNGEDVTGNAVSAASVLYQSTAVMTPYTTVYLWTQSQVQSNTVVTDVTSAMTMVTLSAADPEASLRYDSSSGTFVPASSSTEALFEKSAEVHRLPRGIVCA